MSASLAVVLLNYKRPQNIGRIVAAAREGLPDAPILLLDQAETDSLRERDDIAWSEVWYQRAAVNRGAGVRVPLVARLPFEFCIAIDDDVFMTGEQIARLATILVGEPDRAHGICGQRLVHVDEALHFRGLTRLNGVMSVLNQVYAFSRAQARAAIELAARMGWPNWGEIGPTDDIFLSCAAPKPPLCHDLGPIPRCPTSDTPGVAVWVSEDFHERRTEALRRLMAAQAIALFTAPGKTRSG